MTCYSQRMNSTAAVSQTPPVSDPAQFASAASENSPYPAAKGEDFAAALSRAGPKPTRKSAVHGQPGAGPDGGALPVAGNFPPPSPEAGANSTVNDAAGGVSAGAAAGGAGSAQNSGPASPSDSAGGAAAAPGAAAGGAANSGAPAQADGSGAGAGFASAMPENPADAGRLADVAVLGGTVPGSATEPAGEGLGATDGTQRPQDAPAPNLAPGRPTPQDGGAQGSGGAWAAGARTRSAAEATAANAAATSAPRGGQAGTTATANVASATDPASQNPAAAAMSAAAMSAAASGAAGDTAAADATLSAPQGAAAPAAGRAEGAAAARGAPAAGLPVPAGRPAGAARSASTAEAAAAPAAELGADKHARSDAEGSLPSDASLGAAGAAIGSMKSGGVTDGAAAPTLKVTAGVDTPEFGQGLADRVAYMVGNNLSSAKLQVNPPQLGPIEVRITVQGDHAQVWLTSHSAVTRDALESSSPKLREMLGAQGFGQVSVDISQRHFQDRPAHAQHYEWAPAAGTGSPAAVSAVSPSPLRHSNGAVDAYA